MSLQEKLAYWHRLTIDGSSTDAFEDGTTPEEPLIPPRYDEVREFLLKSHAYKWLQDNVRSSAYLTSTAGTVAEQIAKSFGHALKSAQSSRPLSTAQLRTAIFVDTDICRFLDEQDYGVPPETALEQAITVTSTGQSAQALECGEYIRQTWPSSGNEVLDLLRKAISSPEKRCSGKNSCHVI